ncbi:MAG: hypothetical protein WC873_00780, partial [Candidatus Gracilibacteria bacterium]
MKRTITGALLKHLLRLSLTLAAFFAMSTLSAFAASIYQVAPSTGTVGTSITTLELEYTVDTAVQTWANADTLTVTVPANFPTWADAVTFTVEYDTDVINDGFGETSIPAGAGNGQYVVAADLITIKWNTTGWGAVVNGASTIRILGTVGWIPEYANATSAWTWAGTTAAADTNPSGTANINVSAADAAASVALGTNSVVGAAGNTTLTLTLGYDMEATDTVIFTLPANLDVTAVAFGSETFAGAGTISGCTAAGQVITCTAGGNITLGTGNIVMSGIVSAYTATGQTVTSLAVNDTSAAGADISSDASGTVTDTTAADAAMSVALGTNSVVGAAGNTTLTFTLAYAMAATDTVIFTLPANLDVTAVAFGSETFAGAGTISGCTAAGQVITCTAGGAITAGTGNIVMSGIVSAYVATGQTVTSLAVNDTSASGADISSDASGTVTDTTVADAAMSVTLGTNSVVGAAGNTTLTFTLAYAMASTDTVIFTLPANLDVTAVAFGSETFAGAGTISGCTAAGQVITCTAGGAITAGTGNIVMSGIVSKYVATGQTVTTMAVNDTSASGADISSDASGTVTDTTVADAAASVALGTNSVVGAAGNTTLTLTIAYGLTNTDTVVFTLPANLDVTAVAFGSETFAGAGTISGCTAAGQVITCTAGGAITAGTGTIVMSGIVSAYAATAQTVTSLAVNDVDAAGADISSDASGTVTDTTAGDAAASVTLGANSVVGNV